MTQYKPTKMSITLSSYALIYFIVFIGFLNFGIRDGEELKTGLFSVSVLHRLISVFILGLYLVPKLPTILSMISKNKLLRLFSIYLLYKLTTALWSVSPLWTAYRAIEYSCVFALMVYLVFRESKYNGIYYTIGAILVYYSLLILSAVIGFLIFPQVNLASSQALLPKIVGTFPIISSTSLGLMSLVVLLIMSLNLVVKSTLIKYLIILMSLTVFVLAQSRTALLIGMIYFLVLSLKKMPAKIKLLLIPIILFFLVSNVFEFNTLLISYFQRGQDIEMLLSLSSRVGTWIASISYFLDSDFWSKLAGLGAFAGVRFYLANANFLDTREGASLFTTDNLWIEILIDEGMIGIFFVIILVYMISKNILKMSDSNLRTLILCIWIGLLMSTITVANLLLHTNILFMLVLMTASKSIHTSSKKILESSSSESARKYT